MNTLGLELSTPGAQGSRYCERGPVGVESQANHDSAGGTWCVEAPTHTYTTPTCSPACPLKGWLSSKVLPSPGSLTIVRNLNWLQKGPECLPRQQATPESRR